MAHNISQHRLQNVLEAHYDDDLTEIIHIPPRALSKRFLLSRQPVSMCSLLKVATALPEADQQSVRTVCKYYHQQRYKLPASYSTESRGNHSPCQPVQPVPSRDRTALSPKGTTLPVCTLTGQNHTESKGNHSPCQPVHSRDRTALSPKGPTHPASLYILYPHGTEPH
jgi:hypothetical protein